MQMIAILHVDPYGGYVALNPETGTTTQGGSVEEAIANLREAVQLYLEEFSSSLSTNSVIKHNNQTRSP